MDFDFLKKRLEGCYVTVPTMFKDSDLGLNLDATRSHVRFLMERGINEENAVILSGGAAGDFSNIYYQGALVLILDRSVSSAELLSICFLSLV